MREARANQKMRILSFASTFAPFAPSRFNEGATDWAPGEGEAPAEPRSASGLKMHHELRRICASLFLPSRPHENESHASHDGHVGDVEDARSK